jgi:hypothetical protein
MSIAERNAERELADLYNGIRPPKQDKGPWYPRAKTFVEGFGTGYALAKVWRMLTK